MKPVLFLTVALPLAGCGVGASPDTRSAASEPAFETELYGFREVAGTRYLVASLHPERSRSSSYVSASRYGGDAVNLLFYDLDARSAAWLFPSNAQRVLETLALARTPPSPSEGVAAEEGEVRAFLYRTVSPDTNGDLDEDDAVALAVSAPDGGGYSVLVPDAERFLGWFWVDEGTVLLTYEAGGDVRGVEVDVEKREAVRRVGLPSAPGPLPPG